MRRKVMVILLLITPLIVLSGCVGQGAINSQALYDCRNWPEAPEKPRTDKDRAEYITKGYSAWASCKDAIIRVEPDQD